MEKGWRTKHRVKQGPVIELRDACETGAAGRVYPGTWRRALGPGAGRLSPGEPGPPPRPVRHRPQFEWQDGGFRFPVAFEAARDAGARRRTGKDHTGQGDFVTHITPGEI